MKREIGNLKERDRELRGEINRKVEKDNERDKPLKQIAARLGMTRSLRKQN